MMTDTSATFIRQSECSRRVTGLFVSLPMNPVNEGVAVDILCQVLEP